MWGFLLLAKIQKLAWFAIKDLSSLANGYSVHRQPRYKSIFKNNVLKIIWRMFYRSLIHVEELIIIGGNLIGKRVEKIHSLHEEFLHDIQEMEEAYSRQDLMLPNNGE